ncbi:hypothetical protein R3P38DRAFT_2918405, partial [Favolaschia claudopus]
NAPRHKLDNHAILHGSPHLHHLQIRPPPHVLRPLPRILDLPWPTPPSALVLHLPASHLPPAIHPGPTPTPNTSSTFPKISPLGNITPNPSLQIQSALVRPDDHLAKFQHTLAYRAVWRV